MKKTIVAFAAGLLAALAGAAWADGVEVLWLGQSATRITTPGAKVILIDPFLTQNPELGLKAFLPDGAKALDPFGEISGIPTTLLVDRQGHLIRRWSGYAAGRARQALDEGLKGR